MKKGKVHLFVQLGSPEELTVKSVRCYLKDFLDDPRILTMPKIFRKIIVYIFILPFRPRKTLEAYKRIFVNGRSPLVIFTEKFLEKIKKINPDEHYDLAYLLNSPKLEDKIVELEKEYKKIKIVPLYPQYSEATIAPIFDRLNLVYKKKASIPPFEIESTFYNSKNFISAFSKNLVKYLDNSTNVVVLSFHGLPLSTVTERDDPYFEQVLVTFSLIKKEIKKILSRDELEVYLSFQSRLGNSRWLMPYTIDKVKELVEKGHKKIVIASPSFYFDCLETIDELGNEMKKDVEVLGGELKLAPSLNDDDDFVKGFIEDLNSDIDDDKHFALNHNHFEDTKEIIEENQDLNVKERKRILYIIFWVLFIDIIGFSIIFPLFPALQDFYLLHDRLGVLDFLKSFLGEENEKYWSVLFGGMAGGAFSLFQFLFSPFWGSLSDKIGRKKCLTVTLIGTIFSHLLFFVANDFSIFLLSRSLAGLFAGNISVAASVIADVTSKKDRSKGMATIGIAFGLGMMLGPAIGGLSSLIHVSFHPFSFSALLMAFFSFMALVFLVKSDIKSTMSDNVQITLFPSFFNSQRFKGLIFSYFTYMVLFAGFEFSLSFFLFERFMATTLSISTFFIFIAIVSLFSHGVLIRKLSGKVEDEKLVIIALFLFSLGMAVMACSFNTFLVFVSLFLISVGASLLQPLFSAMVSCSVSELEQGKAQGSMRFIGALARLVAPISFSILYWKSGVTFLYFFTSILIFVPLFFIIFNYRKKIF